MKSLMSYAISLKLENRKTLVLGGGKVALRKVKGLLRAKADVLLVAPEVSEAIEKLGGFEIRLKEYESSDLEGIFLCIAATNDKDINDKIAADCAEKDILFSCVDTKTPCDFYVSAILRRGDLNISVNTNGKVPGLSRSLKQRLDKSLSADWSEFVDFLNEKREALKILPLTNTRQKLLCGLGSKEVVETFETQGLEAAKALVDEKLSHHD
jgi:precorrin-2 dehydrogenase/sirohydrochlorin ferrochelatase